MSDRFGIFDAGDVYTAHDESGSPIAVHVPPVFGIPNDIFMADSERGGFRVLPTAYSIQYRNDEFPRVSIDGVIGEMLTGPKGRQEQLSRFTILELMDEVGRRIKTGENKKGASDERIH